MPKTRIAIVGLGMAVAPHARSALDLAERVDVAYAFSPSAARREQFAQQFPFPQCDRIESILNDASQPPGLIGEPNRPGRIDRNRVDGEEPPSLERDFGGLQSVEANDDRVFEGPDAT